MKLETGHGQGMFSRILFTITLPILCGALPQMAAAQDARADPVITRPGGEATCLAMNLRQKTSRRFNTKHRLRELTPICSATSRYSSRSGPRAGERIDGGSGGEPEAKSVQRNTSEGIGESGLKDDRSHRNHNQSLQSQLNPSLHYDPVDHDLWGHRGRHGTLEGYQYTSGNSRFSTRQATFTGAIEASPRQRSGDGRSYFLPLGWHLFTRRRCDHEQCSRLCAIWLDHGHVLPAVPILRNSDLDDHRHGGAFQRRPFGISQINGEMVPWSTPVYYLIGGIMCYFVNGITAMIANTIGLEVGLDNMCKAFGMAGA
ncbi:hypothetical protein [Shinella zoogloeoides]|uniref:hypothetical protein n=1 Tax=Shinella zoogloeoides TaxID=352475 RepID=UPI00299E17AA|nr:hypothetical protein [Shinella zoogloeoides]